MALDWGSTKANGNYIAVGNSFVNENHSTFTWCCWINPEAPVGSTVYRVFALGNGAPIVCAVLNSGASSDSFEMERYYTTTNCYCKTANNEMDNWYGSWAFIACVDNGVGSNPQIFIGDLSTLCTDKSSTQTPGAGDLASSSSEVMYIGNRSSLAHGTEGQIAWQGIYSGALTQAELQQIQVNPIHASLNRSDTIAHWHLGLQGTSDLQNLTGDSNYDWSAGTGVSLFANPSTVMAFPSIGHSYNFAAAAASYNYPMMARMGL